MCVCGGGGGEGGMLVLGVSSLEISRQEPEAIYF